jgi:hypothetical protein
MPDIFHDFIIKVPPARVFEGVSTPQVLDGQENGFWESDQSFPPRSAFP